MTETIEKRGTYKTFSEAGHHPQDKVRLLPDQRSARDHGPYSAYCRVCWNACYVLWIDREPHGGVCVFGHAKAEDCPDAINRARSELRRLRETPDADHHLNPK